jgi:hypothetical protein
LELELFWVLFLLYSFSSFFQGKSLDHFTTQKLEKEKSFLIDLLRLCYYRSIIKECSKSVGELNAG